MEIISKTKAVEMFHVDGKEFHSKEAAEDYVNQVEMNLEKAYYYVTTGPDLTEGRGYSGSKIIVAPKLSRINSVYQYLMKHHGEPISFIQGSTPTPTYIVSDKKTFDSQDDLDSFLKTKYTEGGHMEKDEENIIYINESGVEINDED